MNSKLTGEGDDDAAAVVQKTSLQFLPKTATFEHIYMKTKVVEHVES